MLAWLIYISDPLKTLLRAVLLIMAVYFLFLTVWDAAYIGKRMRWPAVEATFEHRQVNYRFTPFHSPGSRSGGSNRGLFFVEETFYIPSRKISVTAADFGYLSRRKAVKKFIAREKELPMGTATIIRVKDATFSEVTSHRTFGAAFKATGLGYLLGALASLLGVGILSLI